MVELILLLAGSLVEGLVITFVLREDFMTPLNNLERKFGRYAIRELMVYIVGINALVYILSYAMPQSEAISMLLAQPPAHSAGGGMAVDHLDIHPSSASLLWIFFILYFYYIVGTGLEHNGEASGSTPITLSA